MIKQASQNPAFLTPAAVAAITEAYAEACRIAKATDRDHQLRFRLADRIIFLARNGEKDPRRLTIGALAAVMHEPSAQRCPVGMPSGAVPGATSVGEFRKAP